MAKKKKGGKGKGKKGKKEAKKGKLSHREREIYLLSIEDLRHKIEWRNHMCGILEEDLALYGNAIEAERRDKEQGVTLLEEVVLEQKEACRKAEWALPDAEQSKAQAEERRGRELASKLVLANEEAVTYDAELRLLRRKLKSLEAYDAEKVDLKIRNLEAQLRTEDEDALLKGREQDRRRVEAFRNEMFEILEEEAESFQGEVSGKLDEHLERIAEETRWWLDTASGLRIAKDRLRSLNDAQSRNLRESLRDHSMRRRKEASLLLQAKDIPLMEQRALATVGDEEEPPRSEEAPSEDKISPTEEECWLEMFGQIKRNEEEIVSLENQLRSETRFGRDLSRFVARAVEIMSSEARRPLVVTYDGPPVEGRTLSELRGLFEEATQYIYDKKDNQSLL